MVGSHPGLRQAAELGDKQLRVSQAGPGVWPEAWELLRSCQSTRDAKNHTHVGMSMCAHIYNVNNYYIIMYNRIIANN